MLRNLSIVLILGILYSSESLENRPVHTYSIVAYDDSTGQLGVAVQSHWFSVGSLVPWAKAGVGAVATQSLVKVEYGPDGLKGMEDGKVPHVVLSELLADDDGRDLRQVAMIDANGNVASHTGIKCISHAGHQIGNNYSVQANIMEKPTVCAAMGHAFENTKGDLADRMMASLEAAENEGGDLRGKQSASMLIVTGNPTGIAWKDIVMDIRIDDHKEPLKELKRLIRINRAYKHANKGDYYLELEKIDDAMAEYKKASYYYPENPELPYWSAVTLAGIGDLDKALPIFEDVFFANIALDSVLSTSKLCTSRTNIDCIISAYGLDSNAFCCALRIFDAETSSIAFVTFEVFATALMRFLISLTEPPPAIKPLQI